MGVLTLDQIAPDGPLIVIDWDQLKVGSSVFVPCMNTSLAKRQVGEIFKRRGWKMRLVIRPERELWGVRFWRVA